MALAAVQLGPTIEAVSIKEPEDAFGMGFREALAFASMAIPNFPDFNRKTPGPEMPPANYLYLGAPALFGLLWVVRRGFARVYWPAFAMLAVGFCVCVQPLSARVGDDSRTAAAA